MKPFFQGLVFGILVMYGYLNYGTDIFGPFRSWFGRASENFKHGRMRKEADKVLYGFLVPHSLEGQGDEIILVARDNERVVIWLQKGIVSG